MKKIILVLVVMFLTSATQISAFNKGVIYYTENWCNQVSDPLPPGRTTAQFVAGTRYFDLTQEDINFMLDLKLDTVIVGFGPAGWYNISKTSPYQQGRDATEWNNPYYDFAKLDNWISRLQAAGLEVVLQIWGTPSWASGVAANCASDKVFSPQNRRPINLNEFGKFMAAVTRRYDGRHVVSSVNAANYLKITKFSLWNEPDAFEFWDYRLPGDNSGHDVTTAANIFTQMNNYAYAQIKIVSPRSEIWSPNTTSYSAPLQFIDGTANSLDFDVYAHHPYPQDFNKNPEDPAVVQESQNSGKPFLSNLGILVQKLDSYSKYQGKKIVVTETGFRSNWENQFGFPDTKINEDTKAWYLSKAFAMIRSSPRVIGAFNNVLYTPWVWWSTGVINYLNNTKLPAYASLKAQPFITTVGDINHMVRNYDTRTFYNTFRFAQLAYQKDHPDSIPAPWSQFPNGKIVQIRNLAGSSLKRFVPLNSAGYPDYDRSTTWETSTIPGADTIAEEYLPGANVVLQEKTTGSTYEWRYVTLNSDKTPNYANVEPWQSISGQSSLTTVSDAWIPSGELMQTQSKGTTAQIRFVPIGSDGKPNFSAPVVWDVYQNQPNYTAISDTYLPGSRRLMQTRQTGTKADVRYVPINAAGRPDFGNAEAWQTYTVDSYDAMSDTYLP